MIQVFSTFKAGRNIIFLLTCFLLFQLNSFSQGFNHHWLLGYDIALFDTNVTSTKARLLFDSLNTTLIPESRKMPFLGTQANISDANGNLLIATNGCWIANALGDTMLNGTGLNPSYNTTSWCNNTSGLPIHHGDVLLPYPGDSTKFILFHQTADINLTFLPTKLYYTVIDMTKDGGLGGVDTLQKNIIALQDTFSLGIAACKHANGRDWWIVALKDSSDIIYKLLLTSNGITSITSQSLGVPIVYVGEGQPTFSPNGNKFVYTDSYGPTGNSQHNARLFDFDRCSGMFSNPIVIDLHDKKAGLGAAFSANSEFLYVCSFRRIFQININTLFVDTVAINDNYASPYPPFYTDFWTMYLAANGKIYISTGNSTIDLHVIEYPDSAGLACSVQQHSLHLPCFAGNSDVNHPNYYLGCDTALGCGCITSVNENLQHDFHFRIYPNPVTNNSLHIGYLLPQNKSGLFQIYDVNGKVVFVYGLSPWSNEQELKLPQLANGIYNCVITSNNQRVSKKIAVIKE